MSPFVRGSSRGRTISGRSSRRLTAWTDGPGSTTPSAFSATGSGFLGLALAPGVEGLTVVRIRGEFTGYLNLATTGDDGFAGAMGIGIASANAVAIGITAVPTPLDEQEAESWLYWRAFSIKSPVAFALGAAQQGPSVVSSFRIEVDTKAMRKFPADTRLYAAVQVVEVGTASAQFSFDSRALMKLP